MDRAEACGILGVREDATRDDIEKRYGIILKKCRMAVNDPEYTNASTEDMEKATAAYNLLMGYDTGIHVEERNIKPNPVLKKLGVDEKKVKNFFYYYKFYLLFGVITLLLIVFGVKSCVTRVDPDLNIAFVGDFRYYTSETLEKKIKDNLPEVKAPSVDGAYITAGGNSQQDYSMQMKAMVLLAAGDIDVYIMDETNFLKYGSQAAFESIDQLAEQYKVDSSKNSIYALKPEGEQETHLYGIDVSSSDILNDQGIIGEKKIVAISARAKHHEKAVRFVELLLKQLD
jgi:hypothetical protein